MSQEIIEERVTTIEMSQMVNFNKVYRPVGGRVKWFIDELGQMWVKFTTEDSGVIVDHVWNPSLVVEVCYYKS